jgi:hypothetical protein
VGTRGFVGSLLLGLTLLATEASAQTSAPQYPPEGWQFQFVPYLWGSGVDGQVGVAARTADVDASFRNILDHLHFAAIGLADAQRDRLVVMTDAFYTDLRGQKATPGPLFSSVDPQQKIFILTPEAGYRVRETPGGWIDVLGGIRLWHLRTELQFQPGLLPGINVEGSRTWVDAVAGVRARTDLSTKCGRARTAISVPVAPISPIRSSRRLATISISTLRSHWVTGFSTSTTTRTTS